MKEKKPILHHIKEMSQTEMREQNGGACSQKTINRLQNLLAEESTDNLFPDLDKIALIKSKIHWCFTRISS